MVSSLSSPRGGVFDYAKNKKNLVLANKALDGPTVLSLLDNEPAETAYFLNARGKGYTEIVDLTACLRVRTLDVAVNAMRTLRGVEVLKQLRELRAGSNRIDDAEDLLLCASLEIVDLQDNLLTEVPKVLGKLRKLRELRLDRNRLGGGLGTGLSACSALRVLDLSGNALTSVTGLGSLSSLVELDLSRNELSVLAASSLEGCRKSLRELRLGDNCIGEQKAAPKEEKQVSARRGSKVKKNSPLEGLKGFSALRSIGLSRNHVASTAFLFPCAMAGLAELDLSENRLQCLEGLASLAPALDVLKLEKNRLADIFTDVVEQLKPLTELVELHLLGNPCATSSSSSSLRPASARPKTSERPGSARRLCTAAAGAPSWALVLARSLPSLQVLDDLSVVGTRTAAVATDEDAEKPNQPPPPPAVRILPLPMKHTNTLEKLEDLAETENRAESFRGRLSALRSTLRGLDSTDDFLKDAAKGRSNVEKPLTPDHSRKRSVLLERALSYSSKLEEKPHVEETLKKEAPPPRIMKEQVLADPASSDDDDKRDDDLALRDDTGMSDDSSSDEDDPEDLAIAARFLIPTVARKKKKRDTPDTSPTSDDETLIPAKVEDATADYAVAMQEYQLMMNSAKNDSKQQPNEEK